MLKSQMCRRPPPPAEQLRREQQKSFFQLRHKHSRQHYYNSRVLIRAETVEICSRLHGNDTVYCCGSALCSPVGSIWTGSRRLGGSHQYGFPLPVKAAYYAPVKHSECIVCLRGNRSTRSCPLFSISPHHTPGPAQLKGTIVERTGKLM